VKPPIVKEEINRSRTSKGEKDNNDSDGIQGITDLDGSDAVRR
jgi:hypothetical protein